MRKESMRQRMRQAIGASLLMVAASSASAVDINRAGAEELAAQLSNIGLAKARAIVAYRKQNGMFRTVDELQNVDGIGLLTLEANRDKITLGGSGGASGAPAANRPETRKTPRGGTMH